ncbi:hypothetical protein R6Z07M_005835 [Ovis aries]
MNFRQRSQLVKSILPYQISCPGGLLALRDKAGEGNGTPFQYSCLGNPMDGGAWWAAVHGVAKSRTRLKQLSSSSSSSRDFAGMFTHSDGKSISSCRLFTPREAEHEHTDVTRKHVPHQF